MALNVGELFATLGLDDSQFQSAARRSTSTWNSLQGGLTTGAKTAAQALGITASAAVGLALSVSKTGLAYNGLQQNSRAALATLLGGAEAANAQMDKLDEFAKSSPFSKSTFITAQQQLIGFGMSAEKVIPTLDAIQQAVAATGGSSQTLSELTFVLAQVQAAGKVTATDLMQLGQRGVDAATIVGNQMGVTGAEIREMITKGQISADDFITHLTTGMQEKFGGATANIKKQWSGAADRIKAASRDIGASMTKAFIDPHGGGYAVTWGNQVADILRVLQGKVEVFTELIHRRLGGAFENVGLNLTRFKNALAGLDVTKIFATWDRLKDYAPIVSSLAGAVVGVNAQLLAGVPIIGRFAGAFNPVLLGVGALIAASPELRRAVSGFIKSLAPAGEILAESGKRAVDLSMDLLDRLTPAAESVLEAASRLINAWAPLAPAFLDTVEAGLPLVDMAVDLVSAIAGLPTPVLAAVTAMIAFTKASRDLAKIEMVKSGLDVAKTAMSGLKSVIETGVLKSMYAAEQGAGRLGSAFAGIKGGVGAIGGALGGLVTGLGPLGLAFGAVTAAVGIFAAHQAKAAEQARAMKDAGKELADTLDKTTGAYTALTRETLRQQVTASGIGKHLEAMGLSYDTYVDHLLGSKKATAEWNKAIEDGKTLVYTQSGYVQSYSDNVLKAMEYEKHFSGSLKESKAAYERSARAAEAAADSTKNYAENLRDAKRAQDDLNNAKLNLAEARGRQAELLESAKELTTTYEQLQVQADGWFDYSTEGGRKANEQIIQMVQNYEQIRDQMDKAHFSSQDILTTFQYQKEELVGFLTTLTGSEEVARQMADSLMQLDGNTYHTTVELDAAEALEKAENLSLVIDETNGTVEINGNPIPAEMTLGELMGDVDEATGTVTIHGETYDAQLSVENLAELINSEHPVMHFDANSLNADATLQNFVGKVDTTNGTVEIGGNTYPADQKFMDFIGMTESTPGVITLEGNDGPVNLTKDSVKFSIDHTTGTVIITGKDEASGVLRTIRTNLDSVQSKDVWVTVHHQTIMTTVGGGRAAQNAYMKADGGYHGPIAGIHRYAANGLATRRQAMFAPGGSWITWAEDETKGEWYIPAAWEKRRRSMEILADAAAHFGMALVEKPTKQYANGNTVTSPSPTNQGMRAEDLRRAFDGMSLVLRAGGREFEAYVSQVADSRVIYARNQNLPIGG